MAPSTRWRACWAGWRFVALTGAGCSTESGIPDYRGPAAAAAAQRRSSTATSSTAPSVRRRYWARSTLGWPRFRGARPNAGHRALAALEAAGALAGVITQNVDGLHSAAGSRRVVELHGALARVRCLGCGDARRAAQRACSSGCCAANPGWLRRRAAPRSRPTATPSCPPTRRRLPSSPLRACGGVLKPDVVFFGGSVPRADARRRVASCSTRREALLVVGSSLTVFSGYRFVRARRRARRAGRDRQPRTDARRSVRRPALPRAPAGAPQFGTCARRPRGVRPQSSSPSEIGHHDGRPAACAGRRR